MYVLYLYDVKAKDKRQFNRTKRLFYYHLGRLPIKKEAWKTKSALAVPAKQEPMLDRFFRRFGARVEVYKAHVRELTRL